MSEFVEEGGDKIKLEITGPPKNCLRAEGLIKSHIVSHHTLYLI